MLSEERIAERGDSPMFFNPGSTGSWKDCQIFDKMWRYQWEGHRVTIEGPDGTIYQIPSWEILEVSEEEYVEWDSDPFDQPVVMAKDVADYIREKIMRSAMARKIGAGITRG